MVSIRRSGGGAVAVRIDAVPVMLAAPSSRVELEAEMVDAVRLSWKLPGDGPVRQFAPDGPWHLMTRDGHAGDYDARGGDMDDAPPPREPLSQEDMVRIERTQRWLALLIARPVRRGQTSGASDGAIVAAVLRQKATGRSQVDWARVLRAVRLARGKGALADRYSRAMDWLAAKVVRG